MTPAEAARRIGETFDEDRIPYAIGGALALGIWGAPRNTKDVDLSAFVPRDELARVIASLERAGVMVARADAVKEIDRIGLFVARLGRIRIDVFLSEHPQYAEMAQRVRRIADPAGWVGCYLSVEDVVLHKMIYNREKDHDDLARLFAANSGIDLSYVRRWLAQMLPPGDSRFATLDDLERRFLH